MGGGCQAVTPRDRTRSQGARGAWCAGRFPGPLAALPTQYGTPFAVWQPPIGLQFAGLVSPAWRGCGGRGSRVRARARGGACVRARGCGGVLAPGGARAPAVLAHAAPAGHGAGVLPPGSHRPSHSVRHCPIGVPSYRCWVAVRGSVVLGGALVLLLFVLRLSRAGSAALVSARSCSFLFVCHPPISFHVFSGSA